MNEYRLMVVDSDAEYANRIAGFLSGNAGFRLVGFASDGAAALRMFKRAKPDIILIDLLLPGMDGISVLKEIRRMKESPVVICISEAYTSFSIELARRNGVSYYIYKPIEPDSLAQVMTECCSMASERRKIKQVREEISRSGELSLRIHNLLHELGFSFKLNGSEYIAKSVEMAMEAPMLLHNISSGIYRKLAEQMSVSPACIERSMRTAIAFANSEGKLTERIGSVPTNKTCIRFAIRELELRS